MAKIKRKIEAVTMPINATAQEASAKVAHAMGDNATVKATELESVILRASSSHAALLDALRRCDFNQKELQQRAYAARWYAADYMRDVDAGKINAKRDGAGNVIVPPMTDATRKAYLAKLTGKTKDAEIIRRRSALRTWWTRLLFDAGLKAIDNRGGSANAKKRRRVTKVTKATPAPTPVAGKAPSVAPVPAATPRVTTPMEAVAFYQREAAVLMRFTVDNAAPVAGKPSPTNAFKKLVTDFCEAVAKLGLKLDKEAKKAKAK